MKDICETLKGNMKAYKSRTAAYSATREFLQKKIRRQPAASTPEVIRVIENAIEKLQAQSGTDTQRVEFIAFLETEIGKLRKTGDETITMELTANGAVLVKKILLNAVIEKDRFLEAKTEDGMYVIRPHEFLIYDDAIRNALAGFSSFRGQGGTP